MSFDPYGILEFQYLKYEKAPNNFKIGFPSDDMFLKIKDK